LAREYQVVKSEKVTACYDISDGGSLSKGKSNYESSILSKIDLRGLKSFERKYFKKMIVNRLKLLMGSKVSEHHL